MPFITPAYMAMLHMYAIVLSMTQYQFGICAITHVMCMVCVEWKIMLICMCLCVFGDGGVLCI